MDEYTQFMIRMEGFQDAHAFNQIFPDTRALPESRNPYLPATPESRLFEEGAGHFFRSLNDIENGGGFDVR